MALIRRINHPKTIGRLLDPLRLTVTAITVAASHEALEAAVTMMGHEIGRGVALGIVIVGVTMTVAARVVTEVTQWLHKLKKY
jgi:hypothetical protein